MIKVISSFIVDGNGLNSIVCLNFLNKIGGMKVDLNVICWGFSFKMFLLHIYIKGILILIQLLSVVRNMLAVTQIREIVLQNTFVFGIERTLLGTHDAFLNKQTRHFHTISSFFRIKCLHYGNIKPFGLVVYVYRPGQHV